MSWGLNPGPLSFGKALVGRRRVRPGTTSAPTACVGVDMRNGHDGDVTDAASGDAANPDSPASSERPSRPPAEPAGRWRLPCWHPSRCNSHCPNRHVLSPTFLFPTVETLLLIVLLVADPSRLHRRSVAQRRVLLALVIVMTVDNLAAVVEMVRGILDGSKGDTGTVLLATGGAIWLTNVIAFSLWYWLLDRGGPAARAGGESSPPAFAFAEMQLYRAGPSRLVAAVCRLLLPRLHQCDRVQPNRHAARHPMGKDDDAGAVRHLAGRRRHDHLPRRQHPELIRHHPLSTRAWLSAGAWHRALVAP